MITAERVGVLIKNFERILPHAKSDEHLDMKEWLVSSRFHGHQCGTTHCHAGWYLLAKEWDFKSDYLEEPDGTGWRYGSGELALAKDLGFKSAFDLTTWADRYPKIWGNREGARMFDSTSAFGVNIFSLKDIIDHWRGVQERLRAVEGGRDE